MENMTDQITEELISQALQLDSKSDEYWEIVQVLWSRPTAETLAFAQSLCKYATAGERELGANILNKLGSPEDVFHEEKLQSLLLLLDSSTEPSVLNAAAQAVGQLADERSVPALINLKNHPSRDVRYGVVFGLSTLQDESSIAALIEMSADVDSDVRNWATFNLGTLHVSSEAALDALAARVVDEDDGTLAEAIVGLARNKDQRAIEPLIAYLRRLEVEDHAQAYNAGLLYEAAYKLADARLCPVLLEVKSRDSEDAYLDEVLEKCGCNQ